MRFSQQRFLGLVLFLGLSTGIIIVYQRYAARLPRMDYLTGWALFGLIIVLTLYNGRKKLPFLPALSSEAWMQFHIYAGLLTGTLFVVHVNYKMPAGWFRGALAGLYVLVMASGFFGLLISRLFPRRLTTRGGEVLFERIPVIRRQLQEQSEKLALQSVGQAKSGTIADFYGRELSPFFARTRNMTAHLLEVRRPINHILTRISEVNRYLGAEERATMEEMAKLARQKDGLDYHYAHQLLLKIWLFAHIPLTYSLLVFTVVHILMVFAFSGGAR